MQTDSLKSNQYLVTLDTPNGVKAIEIYSTHDTSIRSLDALISPGTRIETGLNAKCADKQICSSPADRVRVLQ